MTREKVRGSWREGTNKRTAETGHLYAIGTRDLGDETVGGNRRSQGCHDDSGVVHFVLGVLGYEDEGRPARELKDSVLKD